MVDEIVVVDSFSSDRTLEIAKEVADVAVQNPFEDFSKQKNYAASLARHEWILNIDADELLSAELKERIHRIKQQETSRYHAFCFPRMTFRKDGSLVFNIVSYPGFHYRLYHKGFCRWRNPVHETLVVDGRRKFYPDHFLHYPNFDLVPEKEELYNRLKQQPFENGRTIHAYEMIKNFWFHFHALFIALAFYRKGWTYWKHGAEILIHLAGLRLKQQKS